MTGIYVHLWIYTVSETAYREGTVKNLNWNQNDGSPKIDVGPSFSFEQRDFTGALKLDEPR